MEGEFSRNRLILGVHLTLVLVFLLDRCEISDQGVQAVLDAPVQPRQGGKLPLIGGAEWAVDLDAFRFVETDDRLGQGVVIAVADRPIDAIMLPTSARRSA